MFCTNCGKQLADEARFCTSCGTAVGEAKKELAARAAPADEVSAAGVPASAGDSFASAAEGAAGVTGVSSDDSASAVAAVASAAGSDAKAAKPVNFKAAMDSTKARGKRRMPTIVLVALALALTSAVAFAAHYVYTGYIAPALEKSGINAPFYHGPADEAEEGASIYQLYNDKIQEYIQAYGEPASELPDESGWAVGNEWYLTGLCFADMVDFGDGVERLVCAYNNKSVTTEDRYLLLEQAHTVEVWQPGADGGIEMAYSSSAANIGNGGYSGLMFFESDGNVYLVGTHYGDPGDLPETEAFEAVADELLSGASIETTLYWGPSGESFEVKKSYAYAFTDDMDYLYAEDGVIVDEMSSSEWWANGKVSDHYLVGYGDSTALVITNETIAELAELASAQPASESEEASAQPVDLKAVNAAYDGVVEEYRQALGKLTLSSDLAELEEQHPHVNSYFLGFLSELMFWGTESDYMNNLFAATRDLDGNGTPELLVYYDTGHNKSIVQVSTYENGQVVEILANRSGGGSLSEGIEITTDGKVFCTAAAGVYGSMTLYSLSGGTLVEVESLAWSPSQQSGSETILLYEYTKDDTTTEKTDAQSNYYYSDFREGFTFVEDLGGERV